MQQINFPSLSSDACCVDFTARCYHIRFREPLRKQVEILSSGVVLLAYCFQKKQKHYPALPPYRFKPRLHTAINLAHFVSWCML